MVSLFGFNEDLPLTYRDALPPCPACAHPLRAHHDRLCCDHCTGILITVEDLIAEIKAATAIAPEIHVDRTQEGDRLCPRCSAPMEECTIHVRLIDTHATSRDTYDRCALHGIWFDGHELERLSVRVEEHADKEWRKRTRFARWRERLFGRIR